MTTENIWRVAQRIHSSLIVRSKTNGDSLFTVSCSVAFVTCRSLSYLHKIIESNHKSPTASICLMTFHNEAIWSINDSTSQASINVFLFIRTLLCLSKRTFELEHYSRFFWIKTFSLFLSFDDECFFQICRLWLWKWAHRSTPTTSRKALTSIMSVWFCQIRSLTRCRGSTT